MATFLTTYALALPPIAAALLGLAALAVILRGRKPAAGFTRAADGDCGLCLWVRGLLYLAAILASGGITGAVLWCVARAIWDIRL